MSDQADLLRQLVRSAPAPADAAGVPPPPMKARSLALTSGKGGVGTSNLALNLAIALGEYGQRVVLVDADLGLANLDLLCGLAPSCDLGDVLAGGRPLVDAVVEGPAGLRIVAGAHGMRTLAGCLADGPARLAAELIELESDADFLLIDAGSGLGPGIGAVAAAADQVVIVTTPEPTSIADAHAAIDRLRGGPTLRAVVNQAASRAEASDCMTRLCVSSRQFHGIVVKPLGYVRADPRVGRAVRRRRPVLLEYPNSAASNGIRRLARTLIEERKPRGHRDQYGFFAALVDRRWGADSLRQGLRRVGAAHLA